MIVYKSLREIKYIRDACKIVAKTLNLVKKAVKPEVTTLKLDQLAADYIKRCGAKPSFKNYHGFPGNICVSVNAEVVHGIPGPKKLKNGDSVSLDIGAVINNYHGDAAITVPVGEISNELKNLLDVTEQALYKGINKAVEGNKIGDISNAIQTYAESYGYGVVRDLVGHGIGRDLHEDPAIANFGLPGRGPTLKNGMTLAIEPMINMGTFNIKTLNDGWTVITADRKPSAHFEHTIAITSDGPEILTKL